jgi:hypothetical protein
VGVAGKQKMTAGDDASALAEWRRHISTPHAAIEESINNNENQSHSQEEM